MRSSVLYGVFLVLAASLLFGASGCYTILAVDDSPRSPEVISAEPAPIVVIVPPPPVALVPVAAYAPMPSPAPEGTPPETVHRTSGPRRDATEPARTQQPEQRPQRTGRSR